uniref:Anthocyanidin 3-O-glucosyltransferase 5-like n=1 Tax=Nicotiana sylvestris TaxID=4096 RepID=A0A1U7UQU0_NICSY|nr:PREDICTED: anthocyanidin 3-O-glucosyltransferase 5-like [Nicotiana sylvestris]
MGSPQLHVGIVASPGKGHLIPVLVLGNRLAVFHNIKATIIIITSKNSPPDTQLLKTFNVPRKLIDVVQIPPVDISNLIDTDAKVVTQICVMVRQALPEIRIAISTIKPDALIVDLLSTEVMTLVSREFNMPKYVFVPTNAWFTALAIYSAKVLDKEIEGQYVDHGNILMIPGCKPVRPDDVVDAMLDRNDEQYNEHVRLGIEYTLSDGILINTWEEAECDTLKGLTENERLKSVVKVQIYPIGPLRRNVEDKNMENWILKWLDKQPSESVLYVSFGSGGTLSSKQMIELAWGLKLSQQRFVWVVRPPCDGGADGSFFSSGQNPEQTAVDKSEKEEDNVKSSCSLCPAQHLPCDGTLDYLPEGFLTRTRDKGLVVQTWAQQVEILSHSAVGFLSHCGWNSTIESLTNGIPMIAWQLYAEQRLNATMLTKELRVAVRPEFLPTKKVVGREEIEKMVRTIMQYPEGKGIRNKAKQLLISAENALRKGGSSYNSMCKVLKDIENKLVS